MNCDTCRFKKRLIRYDMFLAQAQQSDYIGYACTAMVDNGVVVHMYGNGIRCEMYAERKEDG